MKAFSLNSDKKQGFAFNLPLILVVLIFIIVPVAGTFSLTGFFRDVTFLPEKFIGFENYRRLFTDIHFRDSLIFTILFVLVSVTLEIILGTIFALVLNEKFPGRGFLRVAILIPWAIPIAILARVWQLIYNFNYGLLNYLSIHLGFSDSPINWLGSSTGAFFSIVISDVWKTTPFITIIILAGLSTIPNELYKQARIDGTNFINQFFKVSSTFKTGYSCCAIIQDNRCNKNF